MKNIQRMLAWLLIGLALYIAAAVTGSDMPAVQTVLYKLGHVTTLAWFGYWISRNALGRLTDASNPQDRIARAIVVGCVILAGSMGI